MTQQLSEDQKAQMKEARKGAGATKTPAPKGEALAVNQQSALTAADTVVAANGRGRDLAIAEAKAEFTGYAETTQKLTAILSTQMAEIRNGRSAALSSGVDNAEVQGDEDFLAAFKSDLLSLKGSTVISD